MYYVRENISNYSSFKTTLGRIMLLIRIYHDIKLGSINEGQLYLLQYGAESPSSCDSQFIHLLAEVPLHHSCVYVNFPTLQTRLSFLLVTLKMSRPFQNKQLNLPMLTPFLSKNTTLAQGKTRHFKQKSESNYYFIIYKSMLQLYF